MQVVRKHTNSIFNSISYRVGDILIDPGDEWEGFKGVKTVLLTHAHFDHIFGLNRVIDLNPEAVVITTRFGAKMLSDDKINLSRYHEIPYRFLYPNHIRIVEGDETIESGGCNVKVYSTPGHNPSCLTFIIGDDIFTGDAYIPGISTVTYLPFSDKELAAESLRHIMRLAEGKTIRPGHDL